MIEFYLQTSQFSDKLVLGVKAPVYLWKLVVHRNLFSAGILFFKFDSENT